MNIFAKLFGRKDTLELLAEIQKLRAEVKALKKELDIMKLKQQLAEEKVSVPLQMKKLLLNPPNTRKSN